VCVCVCVNVCAPTNAAHDTNECSFYVNESRHTYLLFAQMGMYMKVDGFTLCCTLVQKVPYGTHTHTPHTHRHKHRHDHRHGHTLTNTHTRTHTHMHTHTHTHTHTHSRYATALLGTQPNRTRHKHECTSIHYYKNAPPASRKCPWRQKRSPCQRYRRPAFVAKTLSQSKNEFVSNKKIGGVDGNPCDASPIRAGGVGQ